MIGEGQGRNLGEKGLISCTATRTCFFRWVFQLREECGCFGGKVITYVPPLSHCPDNPVRFKPLHMPTDSRARNADMVCKRILGNTREFFDDRQETLRYRVPGIREGLPLKLRIPAVVLEIPEYPPGSRYRHLSMIHECVDMIPQGIDIHP